MKIAKSFYHDNDVKMESDVIADSNHVDWKPGF